MITGTSHFHQNLPKTLRLNGDSVESILLAEYGGIFATHATAPDRVIFADDEDVERFQQRLSVKESNIGGFAMKLQSPAMDALTEAINEAQLAGLTISPRSADSAARSYSDTISLWASRVEPALEHWVARGRIDAREAAAIRIRSPREQVEEIFRLEKDGLYFAKDLSKSIIYSVAPPGASQHLSMLAFDVSEFADKRIRNILADHGWYQTVVSDLPHFTYLGRSSEELADLGLRRVDYNEQEFWVPDV
jgi:hypothetical protein